VTPRRAEPDIVSRRLALMEESLRDLGLLAVDADPATLANTDLQPQLKALSRSFDGDSVEHAASTTKSHHRIAHPLWSRIAAAQDGDSRSDQGRQMPITRSSPEARSRATCMSVRPAKAARCVVISTIV